jgi:hypothetical protein
MTGKCNWGLYNAFVEYNHISTFEINRPAKFFNHIFHVVFQQMSVLT